MGTKNRLTNSQIHILEDFLDTNIQAGRRFRDFQEMQAAIQQAYGFHVTLPNVRGVLKRSFDNCKLTDLVDAGAWGNSSVPSQAPAPNGESKASKILETLTSLRQLNERLEAIEKRQKDIEDILEALVQ